MTYPPEEDPFSLIDFIVAAVVFGLIAAGIVTACLFAWSVI